MTLNRPHTAEEPESARTSSLGGRIVVGVDGSSGSLAALRWALSEASWWGVNIDAVGVWNYPGGRGFNVVHPQAEGFTRHQIWDFAATKPEQYPLLLHFPYFDLYRKQVVKQADLVLALHRRGDAFSAEEKARNFSYYEALTVRDSSLSACTQAVLAAEVGHLGLAYDYLAEAALMDVDDLEHNTRDGLHMAALAGSWIALVAGLAGMRDRDGILSFAPRLPQELSRLAFKICLRRRRLAVDVRAATATYTLLDGEPTPIVHHGQLFTASLSDPIACPIPDAPAAPQVPTQPSGRELLQRRPTQANDNNRRNG
jgi:alpha,alpha-trehalose phosphorylase